VMFRRRFTSNSIWCSVRFTCYDDECLGNLTSLLITTWIPMFSVDCCGKVALCGADFLENHHGETKDGTDSPSSLV
jgi:hypothetical protein